MDDFAAKVGENTQGLPSRHAASGHTEAWRVVLLQLMQDKLSVFEPPTPLCIYSFLASLYTDLVWSL